MGSASVDRSQARVESVQASPRMKSFPELIQANLSRRSDKSGLRAAVAGGRERGASLLRYSLTAGRYGYGRERDDSCRVWESSPAHPDPVRSCGNSARIPRPRGIPERTRQVADLRPEGTPHQRRLSPVGIPIFLLFFGFRPRRFFFLLTSACWGCVGAASECDLLSAWERLQSLFQIGINPVYWAESWNRERRVPA